eukprot:TRINITY_DN2664_c0_g1_i1.p1 TRINITY_DN2664_c0_g1~~TRINITY_DN2664_c0_g1_i1.p1  ORF type:complete len:199 (+),score=25.89 TRINITY_DN2664_c0_g1_i1:25-597(+)
MASLWTSYNRLLDTNPLFGKAVTSATLMSAGDLLAQFVVEPFSKGHRESYDPSRTARMAAIGMFFNGPAMHYWYSFLYSKFPAKTWTGLAQKVALDQTIFGPAVVAGFFTLNDAMSGKSPAQIKEKLKEEYVPAMKANWTVWPLAMLINFKFVPPQATVLYVSTVAICWNTFLSLRGNRELKKDPEPAHK